MYESNLVALISDDFPGWVVFIIAAKDYENSTFFPIPIRRLGIINFGKLHLL